MPLFVGRGNGTIAVDPMMLNDDSELLEHGVTHNLHIKATTSFVQC